jgi:HD-GYP domain-containing protein (c-di-GMP phosphodiesterase class II)
MNDSDKSASMSQDSKLVAATIELLYVGMVADADIYDADCKLRIVKRGTVLDEEKIEALNNLNNRRRTIYVTNATFRALQRAQLPFEVIPREEHESTTGYAEVKGQTYEFLSEISATKSAPREALYSVSEELSHRLEVIPSAAIVQLINALAPVDEYLERHSTNVGMLNGLMGKWMGLPQARIDELVLTGLIHDCGKALVPSSVLNMPRALTAIEFEVMKMHSVYCRELLFEFPESVRLAASSHHEKVNGRGYPDRMTESEIPLDAKITAISDIYDAMVSQRAYKNPHSPFFTMSMMSQLKGTELDAELVDLFIANIPNEIIGKPINLSNGQIGIVCSVDVEDLQFPVVELEKRRFKTTNELYVASMYCEEKEK